MKAWKIHNTRRNNQGRTTPKLGLCMTRCFHGPVYFQTHFRVPFLRKWNLRSVYERIRSIRYQKGKLNAFKSSEISLLSLQVLLTGLRDLSVNLNSRQNRSKSKLVTDSRPYFIPLGCRSCRALGYVQQTFLPILRPY